MLNSLEIGTQGLISAAGPTSLLIASQGLLGATPAFVVTPFVPNGGAGEGLRRRRRRRRRRKAEVAIQNQQIKYIAIKGEEGGSVMPAFLAAQALQALLDKQASLEVVKKKVQELQDEEDLTIILTLL